MSIKTIFLDRDGVINKDTNYLYKIKDFEFIKGFFTACKHLQNLDYKFIVITNQSGISRKIYSENDYQIITSWMIKQFNKNDIDLLDVLHCPHLPDTNCNCRKPKPGLLLKAKSKYNINMKNSWMIGDKETDIIAANRAGITNTILVKSDHKINETGSNAKYILESILQSSQVILS